jgi:anhydro-N-acetylmuramic acid kinase
MIENSVYLGLMSGTSADAIDAVAVSFAAPGQLRILGHHSEILPAEIRQKIHQLALPGANEIDRLGPLDVHLAELFAECINALTTKLTLAPRDVIAIGSHGQTIRHRPPKPGNTPFTLQIGDPNIIAQRTGITTVADFRRRDMAVGGQGAPLVPAFHRAAFHHKNVDRLIVNIGGMANITWLPKSGEVLGFDTGPGNVLMDGWVMQHLSKSYDADGAWAKSGEVDKALLTELLKHPFFSKTHPKSTGREDFNLEWLKTILDGVFTSPLRAEDVQATLVALTAQSIVIATRDIIGATNAEMYVCGGGAYNRHLLTAIQTLLPENLVATTEALGIAPELIEATAFAWLARQTMDRQPINLCEVTGASQPVILGGVYYA